MAPLPTLTDRPVTACGLRRLAATVLKTKHGDPWDAGMVNQRARQLEKWAVNTGFYDPAQGTVVDCPYGALFASNNEGNLTPVDLIKAWINSDGPQGAGTIPSITETVRRIVELLDPESQHLRCRQPCTPCTALWDSRGCSASSPVAGGGTSRTAPES